MSLHSTNYYNAFVEVAPDSTVEKGQIPPLKGGKKTAATIQFEMISKKPYHYTSDDVVFQVFAEKNDLTEDEYAEARKHFFSKGQPCLRASPLTKRYGWGVHYNAEGMIAIYGVETEQYHEFLTVPNLKVYRAMRSSK